MRVLITGAGGQVGLDVADHCDDVGDDVVALTHADLDVTVEPDVVAAVRDHGPDVVLHTAAWTDVDGCEQDPERAHRVNALGSWWVARACHDARATMVLLSTDYVFDGVAPRDGRGSPRPWTEFDAVAPLNAYGRSKVAAEALVRQALPDHHVVRTAWVCGARGRNFVTTMLRVGRDRGRVEVVDDQVGSPTFTRDLAVGLREVAVSGRYGTVNRTNRGSCSWFELAEAVFEQAGVDVQLDRIGSDVLDRPASRPDHSVLSDLHATASGLSPLPHWRDGLTALLDELDTRDPSTTVGER